MKNEPRRVKLGWERGGQEVSLDEGILGGMNICFNNLKVFSFFCMRIYPVTRFSYKFIVSHNMFLIDSFC